jgi:predicted DNA-binding transcriptional regulator AlpA
VSRTAAPTRRLAHKLRIEPISVGRDHAAAMLGIGLSTFAAHVSRGTLPKPRQIGGRAVWLVEELRAAANALPVSELLPPAAA